MSFKLQGRYYFGFLNYQVKAGQKPSSGVVEFNPTEDLNEDGIKDIEIVYPDGKQQELYVIEDDGIAEPIDNRAEVEAETDEGGDSSEADDDGDSGETTDTDEADEE